ncbi:MAG: hypothetical protein FD152_4509 [Xanthobacteraceae bacterium]|nr:MAG: hypothetical protein FD152_4509 [Xanthobacteraceae bacterium]
MRAVIVRVLCVLLLVAGAAAAAGDFDRQEVRAVCERMGLRWLVLTGGTPPPPPAGSIATFTDGADFKWKVAGGTVSTVAAAGAAPTAHTLSGVAHTGSLALAQITDGSTAGQPMRAGGAGGDPAFGALDLGADVTGTLALASLADDASAGKPLASGGAGDPAYLSFGGDVAGTVTALVVDGRGRRGGDGDRPGGRRPAGPRCRLDGADEFPGVDLGCGLLAVGAGGCGRRDVGPVGGGTGHRAGFAVGA